MSDPMFGMWVSGFAAFFALDCLIDWIKHRRKGDAFRVPLYAAMSVICALPGITQ